MKENKKAKFNIIDALFILIVLTVIAGAVYFFFFRQSANGAGSEKTAIVYTVEAREVDSDVKIAINAGDAVVDSFSLKTIGYVKEVKTEESRYTGTDKTTGQKVISVDPTMQTVVITVEADADAENGYYEVGGYRIGVGEQINLRMKGFNGIGYCTARWEE